MALPIVFSKIEEILCAAAWLSHSSYAHPLTNSTRKSRASRPFPTQPVVGNEGEGLLVMVGGSSGWYGAELDKPFMKDVI